MGFRAKIFAVLAAIGLFPAAILGWLSFSVNRAELEKSVGASQSAVAEEVARGSERFVLQAIESLRLSASILPLGELSPKEVASVLRIPYRQLEFVDAVQLLSASGAPLTPAIFESGNGRPAPLVDAMLRGAPLSKMGSDMAIGIPYAGAPGPVRLPIALRLGEGHLLIAELSLDNLHQQMVQNSHNGTVALLATQAGGLLAAGEKIELADGDRALIGGSNGGVALVKRKDGTEWLASAAPVTTLSWTVLISQPASIALRPAAVVRGYTLFWLLVAAILVVVLGAMLSRRVTEPIERLKVSVQSLLEGRAEEAKVESDDEIGQFAKAFNSMAGQIVKRDEEIRRWNVELQNRVDERTAELKVAQDQILRTRRLAALGSMGAGIAHELNNPLTSIGGLAAILALDLQGSPHEATLKTMQGEVKRVAKIVADMRKLTEQEGVQAGRKFAVSAPVQAALDSFDKELRAKNIRVTAELSRCEAQGDAAQIQQAVANLVENAINAMPEGGELKVSLADVGGDAVKLTVSDTGKGIPAAIRERIFDPFFTTKSEPGGVGMGLPISHRIVEAHHGKLILESAEGKGATFTIVLPAAAAAAHLR
ncbi:MAG TPA: sensor histidine kinase [Myxococcales bacterium]|nr:sensor histidine kinase [Myxococcales bacterium]